MLRIALCLALVVPWSLSQDINFAIPEDLVVTLGFESDLDLAIDDAGNNHIAYIYNDGNREVFYLTDQGNGWQPPVNINPTATLPVRNSTNIHALGFGAGEVMLVCQQEHLDLDVAFKAVVNGSPVTTWRTLAQSSLPNVLLDAARVGDDQLAVLTLRSNLVIDEVVLWVVEDLFADNPVVQEPVIIAQGIGHRFLGGDLAVGTDNALHVAAWMAERVSGAVPFVAYTNNRSGTFAPVREEISDARGGDLALHVDDFNRVYLHARNATESRTKVSTDGGSTFPSVVSIGSQDIWTTVGRSDGLDLFTLDQIDVNMQMFAIRGQTSLPAVNVPTPSWRMGDVEVIDDEYRAITTGSLRYTTTEAMAPPMLGDVNRDGAIDSVDTVWIVGSIEGTRQLFAGQYARADFDGDLLITQNDLRALVNLVLGRGD